MRIVLIKPRMLLAGDFTGWAARSFVTVRSLVVEGDPGAFFMSCAF
jgi:hypothetical protein